jgi:hypothetical protein
MCACRSQRQASHVIQSPALNPNLQPPPNQGNCDAEGRLILADALFEAAASAPRPDLIIDAATLTVGGGGCCLLGGGSCDDRNCIANAHHMPRA